MQAIPRASQAMQDGEPSVFSHLLLLRLQWSHA
jgi:hypothetical protein